MKPQNPPKAFAYYMGLSLSQITSEFRRDFVLTTNKAINRSKAIIAMERKKEGDKSITAFMKEEFGFADSNAFKPCVVFRELVSLDAEGKANPEAGSGEITEAHFDAVTAITIHIAASAILNSVAKQWPDAEDAAPYREDVAKVLREHKTDGDTLKSLEILKAKIKPAPKAKTDKETQEGEQTEEVEKLKNRVAELEGQLVPLTPMAILGLLNKATFASLLLHLKENPTEAFTAASLLQTLAKNTTTVLPVVESLVPVAKAA